VRLCDVAEKSKLNKSLAKILSPSHQGGIFYFEDTGFSQRSPGSRGRRGYIVFLNYKPITLPVSVYSFYNTYFQIAHYSILRTRVKLYCVSDILTCNPALVFTMGALEEI
jgi:hypothetical protein